MKCHRQPQFLLKKGVQIASLLEIRLAPRHWNRIRIAAWQRGTTYSTVTRFCVFRLARKCALQWTPRLRVAKSGVEQGITVAQGLHRHLLCLYGDDEKLIRLAAMDLGVTLTMFVRLAIEMFLDALAMEKRSRRFVTRHRLKWEAIRFLEEIQISADNAGGFPHLRTLNCLRYAFESYW